MKLSPDEKALGKALIENLNENGWHILAPASLLDKSRPAQNTAMLDKMLHIIRCMDPEGTCCNNMEESLYVQAQIAGDAPPLALFILDGHIDVLYSNDATPDIERIKRKIIKLQEASKRESFGGERAIDSLLAVGKGQRLGIFSGSGVGKSTLLGMIARNTNADVNVIALIGERGREVVDFLQRDLGEDGLKRSVVVTATSDQSPIARLRGAYTATAVAEYFRDQGKDVMLMFDSVTRFARAQREIGLAIGEPPAQRGYTPSVFETMPKLLERSGTAKTGSITGFYTVLVDGDDMDEPVSDTVRGILDGHIILSRKLAQAYHFPAIDVLASISRLSKRVSGSQTQKAVGILRTLMASYANNEMMITTGIYQKGNSPEIDAALEKHAAIEAFLMQEEYEKCPLDETLKKLSELSGVAIPIEEYGEAPVVPALGAAEIAEESE